MARSKRPELDEEDEAVVAQAQVAWDAGRPEEAGRILQEYLERRPERADAIKGRGFAGPGVTAGRTRLAPPPDVECLRCGGRAPYRRRLTLHGGRNLAPVILGDLGELFVDLHTYEEYGCPDCGHVELFLPGLARDVTAPLS